MCKLQTIRAGRKHAQHNSYHLVHELIRWADEGEVINGISKHFNNEFTPKFK